MARLLTESLEPRRLMHGEGDVFTNLDENGVLHVVGVDSAADTDVIRLYISTDGTSRFINAERSGLEDSDVSAIGYLESDVVGVEVSTFQGADLIEIAQRGDAWTLPVTVFAGKGNDTILSGPGADSIFGGAGDDSVRAGAGPDYVSGGDGNDSIGGGAGPDTIVGGAGNDSINGATGHDALFGLGNDGTVLTVGATDFDTIFGAAGNDTIGGGPNADMIFGGSDPTGDASGDDNLAGGNGHDTIYAGDGNDTLTGGKGNDVLNAGTGTNSFFAQDNQPDTLTGTEGATTLLFDVDLDTLDTLATGIG